MAEEENIASTLLLMGPESVPICEQFQFDENVEIKEKTLNNIPFGGHFEPVKNAIYERMKFNRIVQGDLPIHQLTYIINLQTQANVCEYGDMKDELVRDRIVVGVKDKRLREYLRSRVPRLAEVY